MHYYIFILLLSACITISSSCSPCKCEEKWDNEFSAHCSILHTNEDLFDIPKSLPEYIIHLNISRQSLETITNTMLKKFYKLTEVSFGSNIIDVIEPNAFKTMNKLRRIWLNTNLIKYLPPDVFSDLEYLTEFHAQYNKIMYLPSKLFYNLPYLRFVSFYSNEISFIENDCFSKLPQLTQVDLGGNKLQNIDPNIIDNKFNFIYFSLDDNFWKCNEDLCPLMHFLSDRTKQSFVCSSPASVENKTWASITYNFVPRIANTYYVNKGDTVALQCQYCFAEDIIWKFNDIDVLSDGNIEVSSSYSVSTLNVDNINEKKEGNYSCHVKTCDDCKHATTRLVIVDIPNMFSKIHQIDDNSTVSSVNAKSVEDKSTNSIGNQIETKVDLDCGNIKSLAFACVVVIGLQFVLLIIVGILYANLKKKYVSSKLKTL